MIEGSTVTTMVWSRAARKMALQRTVRARVVRRRETTLAASGGAGGSGAVGVGIRNALGPYWGGTISRGSSKAESSMVRMVPSTSFAVAAPTTTIRLTKWS